MSSYSLLRPPSTSNILVRSAHSPLTRSREYLSLEIPQRIKMYMQQENRPRKPTLESIKKAKSLASIRLLAANKMRVRSSKPYVRSHLYNPITMDGLYRRDAIATNPYTGARQLAINLKSDTPNPLEVYLTYAAPGMRSSRPSITSIDQVKKEIQEELRRREQMRRRTPPTTSYTPIVGIKQEPRKRVQSGRHPQGLVIGNTIRPQLRVMSAKNLISHQASTTGQQIAPWQPYRGEQDYYNDSIFP